MDWLTSPPLALALFGLLAYGLYRWSGRIAPRGRDDEPGKIEPYAGGQELVPEEMELSYQRYFRLGLMFVVVHMAALVVAMLPLEGNAWVLAAAFLLGTGLCVDVLTHEGEES